MKCVRDTNRIRLHGSQTGREASIPFNLPRSELNATRRKRQGTARNPRRSRDSFRPLSLPTLVGPVTPIFSDESASASAGGAFLRVAHASRVLAEASRLSALPAPFRRQLVSATEREVRFGGTPKPTAGTAALPGVGRLRRPSPSERILPRSLKIGGPVTALVVDTPAPDGDERSGTRFHPHPFPPLHERLRFLHPRRRQRGL